jgi:hypothetical protein
MALFVRLVPRRKRKPPEKQNPFSDSRLSRRWQFGRWHKEWHYLALLRGFLCHFVSGYDAPDIDRRAAANGHQASHRGRTHAADEHHWRPYCACCAPVFRVQTYALDAPGMASRCALPSAIRRL